MLMAWPTMASAQSDFMRLDWDELRIDSVLPVYAEVIPLESDYRSCDYSVSIRFPEWAPLTSAEAAVAERFREQLSDSLCIDAFVGVSRGQGLIDVSFVPIIIREGRYLKLISGKMEIMPMPKATRNSRHIRLAQPTRADSITTWRYADHSVLAKGQWMKISVTENGIHHLSNNLIRKMGFDPQRVRVYGYGGHRQNEVIDADNDWDDLEEVALMPVADGYLFYANGLVHWSGERHVINHYANAACYFVTEAESAVTPIASVSAEPTTTGEAAASHIDVHYIFDPQEYSWYQGGRQFYESYDYATGNSRSYVNAVNAQDRSERLPAYPATLNASDATLTIRFSASDEEESTTVTPTFNNETLTAFTISSIGSYDAAVEVTRSYSISADKMTEANVLKLTATQGKHARLNYFTLSYDGLLRLDENVRQCAFDSQQGQLSIEYAEGQQPQLWRLAHRGQSAVALSGTTMASDGSRFYQVTTDNDGETCSYIAFDAAAYTSYPQPTIVGNIANQDLHATDSLDMVILTPASGIFDAQAERLAAIHRDVDNMRVGVFRADQVYNEFSSGTPDATAYRRFMKMLYDRGSADGTAPRYLLLFGDGAWDNRMVTSAWRTYSPDNFLLCYESENSLNDIRSYVMEEYYGFLDDGEGERVLREKTDLGVGRFPVRTVAEAQALVDKTINYINSEYAGAWKNVIAFLGDDGDNNDHLQKANDVAESVIAKHPEIEVRKVMWDAYPRVSTASGFRFPQVRQIIDKQMEEGALMMNYTGHAATYCLSHEQVLRIEDIAAYTSPRVPLWVTAACDVMPFDTQKENFGETAILNTNAAAVAFYGTTRTVYANKNVVINRAFCDAVFDADDDGRPNRLGDAVRYSKTYVATTEGESFENKVHYVLLGDPALRLGSVQNRVVLDSINGTAVADLPDDYTLHAGGRVRLTGHLIDVDGESLTTFEGTLHTRLYDSKSQVVCLNADGADVPFTFTSYDKILFNGTDSVHGGRFALTCPIPVDIKYSDEAGRLLFYAISSDRRTEANGYCQDFLLGGTEPGFNDTEGPKIEAWLGSEDFENGGSVCSTPYFIARLEDESGINTTGNSLGHDLELIVDGDPATTYNLNSYYTGDFGDFQRGAVAFTIPALAEGQHSLLFRAWDTQNNENHVTLDFLVDPKLKMHLLDLTTSINPATTQTSFLLTYDRPGSTCQFTLEVFDFAGRTLWTHTETGSNANGLYTVPWNLTTGSGFPLGSGIYLYRARVSCDDSKEVTKARKLIINRRQ